MRDDACSQIFNHTIVWSSREIIELFYYQHVIVLCGEKNIATKQCWYGVDDMLILCGSLCSQMQHVIMYGLSVNNWVSNPPENRR